MSTRSAMKWRGLWLVLAWALLGCIVIPDVVPPSNDDDDDSESTDSGAAGSSTTISMPDLGSTGADSSDTTTGDASTTEVPSDCGNGRLDPGEDCDDLDLQGATCQGLGFEEGMLGCSANCEFDVSGCVGIVGMVEILQGAFMMGSDVEPDEMPPHVVQVDTFFIDLHEVTVAEYRDCVMAGACNDPGSGGDCNWQVRGRDNNPINCVRWGDADDYCRWVNMGLKRLPTEAEWEKAARGMARTPRTYPWADLPEPNCDYVVMAGPEGCAISTMDVGTKTDGNTPEGVQDMAGNVREWVADWYDVYDDADRDNPQGPADGRDKVLRGGSWGDEMAGSFRGAKRVHLSPTDPNAFSGFRCASDP